MMGCVNLNYTLVVTLLSGWLVSCSGNQAALDKEGAVARVYDAFLTGEELASVIPPGTDKKDSVKIAKDYIQSWISRKAVLKLAEDNLGQDSTFDWIEAQLKDYKNSLIRYAYEKELVNQQLDTQVTEKEIEAYFEKYKNNFELKDNIIQVIYLKVKKNAPKLDRVRNWYKSNQEKDKRLLEDYCFQFAENYFLEGNTWLLFDDLLKEIPIRTYDKEQFLKNNRFIEIEDDQYIYFVNIKGFKIKNSAPVLSFEKEKIISTILNRRKLRLLEEMENNALENARKKNEIEVF